jgi:hypothetical protein
MGKWSAKLHDRSRRQCSRFDTKRALRSHQVTNHWRSTIKYGTNPSNLIGLVAGGITQ